jgi:hypothetical protein
LAGMEGLHQQLGECAHRLPADRGCEYAPACVELGICNPVQPTDDTAVTSHWTRDASKQIAAQAVQSSPVRWVMHWAVQHNPGKLTARPVLWSRLQTRWLVSNLLVANVLKKAKDVSEESGESKRSIRGRGGAHLCLLCRGALPRVFGRRIAIHSSLARIQQSWI